MSTEKLYHYVYRITNKVTNKHYYGCRSCTIPPNKDLGVKYYSSSKDKSFVADQKQNPSNYKYKIVKVYSNRLSAILLEIKLHSKFDVGVNPRFYNKSKQTASKFDTTGVTSHNKGKPHSEATRAKIKETLSKLPNPEIRAKKISEATKGIKHPRAQLVNVYRYGTDALIAENVIIRPWCKEHGYTHGLLGATAKADRSKPHHCTKNPHKHKDVYARFVLTVAEKTSTLCDFPNES